MEFSFVGMQRCREGGDRIEPHIRGFESGERFIRSPPSISAFSPSVAPLAEATRRLAGYAHDYPGLRRFAAGP
jgi:hypothetical protein